MDFGMPTLIENKTLEDNIALCKELNLRFLELNMNLPEYQVEKLEDTSYLREAADGAGIYYTIHLDENLNIADFNKAVADAYLETVQIAIDAAKKLHAPILNMHMNHGIYFTLPDRKEQLFEKYFDRYMESFQHFREMCEQQIGTSGITICIENTDGFCTYEEKAIEFLLQSKVFALTWDIGHSAGCSNVDEPFLMAHENRLQHFHIHDALGKRNHLTLGTGEIDLKQRLSLAEKHRCRCVVETKTIAALRQSVQWLKNTYRNGTGNEITGV